MDESGIVTIQSALSSPSSESIRLPTTASQRDYSSSNERNWFNFQSRHDHAGPVEQLTTRNKLLKKWREANLQFKLRNFVGDASS
jgi:hypothetical protein